MRSISLYNRFDDIYMLQKNDLSRPNFFGCVACDNNKMGKKNLDSLSITPTHRPKEIEEIKEKGKGGLDISSSLSLIKILDQSFQSQGDPTADYHRSSHHRHYSGLGLPFLFRRVKGLGLLREFPQERYDAQILFLYFQNLYEKF